MRDSRIHRRLFASKPAEFYPEGIEKQPGKKQSVIANNGEYIIK